MSQGGVLIVDDDLALLRALPQALRLQLGGVTVETADSAAAALERIAARDYDAIVADIKMPGMDGLELLTEIRTRWPDTPTLMITGHGENELVVGALRGGACDFIHKPIDRDYLVTALQRAMATHEASRRVKEQQLALEHHLDTLEVVVEERAQGLRGRKEVSESPLSWLMGSSGQMEQVVQQIKQVADSPLTVLVEGETGTGKELVARAIHHLSARRDKPFVGSSWPEAERCSSMKSSIFLSPPRRSCCVRCRCDRCSRSEARSRSRCRCGSSPPPMCRSSARCGRAGSAKMSTIA